MANKYLIKDTTKSERIALIKSWVPEEGCGDDCGIDLWDMYAEYINGTKEIAEINASFQRGFYQECDLREEAAGCGEGRRK